MKWRSNTPVIATSFPSSPPPGRSFPTKSTHVYVASYATFSYPYTRAPSSPRVQVARTQSSAGSHFDDADRTASDANPSFCPLYAAASAAHASDVLRTFFAEASESKTYSGRFIGTGANTSSSISFMRAKLESRHHFANVDDWSADASSSAPPAKNLRTFPTSTLDSGVVVKYRGTMAILIFPFASSSLSASTQSRYAAESLVAMSGLQRAAGVINRCGGYSRS
mmetsp:Transcript_12670/g.53099  ORF Transcript_12670/g.53099 Transcript_12670/m.53099 type:complete len:224 (+) Transcript_12670:298-969(+)